MRRGRKKRKNGGEVENKEEHKNKNRKGVCVWRGGGVEQNMKGGGGGRFRMESGQFAQIYF